MKYENIIKKVAIVLFVVLLLIGMFFVIKTRIDYEKPNYEYNQKEITYREVIQDDKIKYEVPSNWMSVDRTEVENALFYAPIISESWDDVSFYTTYDSLPSEDYEIIKKSFIDVFSNYENLEYNEGDKIYSRIFDEFTNEYGFKVIGVKLSGKTDEYDFVEYYYYVIKKDFHAMIWGINLKNDYVNDVGEVIRNVANKMYIY